MASSPSTRTKVFISYSHADKEWLERLKRHLKPFIAEGARDLRWTRRICLSSADAVHVASPLDRGCAKFITTDGGLSPANMRDAVPKLAPLGLQAIAGSGTVVLLDRYRQGDLLSGGQGTHDRAWDATWLMAASSPSLPSSMMTAG